MTTSVENACADFRHLVETVRHGEEVVITAGGVPVAVLQPVVMPPQLELQRDAPYTVGGVDYREYITVEPGKRSGQPCIRGMRIAVRDVLEYLSSGMTQEEVLDDFPFLTRNDILACLAFAADQQRLLRRA